VVSGMPRFALGVAETLNSEFLRTKEMRRSARLIGGWLPQEKAIPCLHALLLLIDHHFTLGPKVLRMVAGDGEL
jgi:hypothetical protein